MTRQDAINLYSWLKDSYPRNYAGADERRTATVLDNLTRVFANETFQDVWDEYRRVYGQQKTEPHPSEILANLKKRKGPGSARGKEGLDPYQVYEKLRVLPEYGILENAYGASLVRRTAKICTQFGTIAELKWRLEHDE